MLSLLRPAGKAVWTVAVCTLPGTVTYSISTLGVWLMPTKGEVQETIYTHTLHNPYFAHLMLFKFTVYKFTYRNYIHAFFVPIGIEHDSQLS